MTISRRNLIELSVVGAAAIAASKRPAVAAQQPIDEIRDSALAFFTARRYAELPPLDMITGDDFNGGLRFDDTRADQVKPWVSVQPAARVDDIEERDRPGVLATFNIIGIGHPGPGDAGAPLDDVLSALVEQRGLAPERMIFVSTPVFAPHVERSDIIRAGRLIERSFDEAKAAGDGSGYFAPPGHPHGPAFHSVGIYYPVADSPPELDYPPAGHVEIAEVDVSPADMSPLGPRGSGIGLERLAMAEGKPVPDFDESRLNLLRIIEDEARREGKPLPPGYTMFASL